MSLAGINLHKLLPFWFMRTILKALFRVEVRGLENYAAAGDKVLIIANHLSSLDAMLIAAFLPKHILFATPATIAKSWWLRPYWSAGGAYTLDQADAMTAKLMVDAIKQKRKCMIFPEGRLSRTGGLMKIYEGPGLIADKADATILPLRIDGSQYTFFSILRGNVRRRLTPKITLTLLPPCRLHLPEEIKGRERRKMAEEQIHNIMEQMLLFSDPLDGSLLGNTLKARDVHGGRYLIIEDKQRQPLTYNQFITQIFAFARLLKRVCSAGKSPVAVMMPNAVITGTCVYAVQALGRVTAMINFTTGAVRIAGMCKMAQIENVITSRAFIEGEKLTSITDALQAANVQVLYLEDLRQRLTSFDKITAYIRARLPTRLAMSGIKSHGHDPAVILFTSGTEGSPKGVVLSHRNIIANCSQFNARLALSPSDRSFACLPMFHSFGLTLGLFAELFYGIRTLLYPSPLHYHVIPELIYDAGSTIVLGTDTFLHGYAHNAHPHDFYFTRYVVAGAEKLKAETRRIWMEKFGVRILEGYGTTETAPVLTVNSPLHYRQGTIGKMLTGIEVKLAPIDGLKDGANLVVRGPNIMLGYIKEDKPGIIQPLKDSWYDTGDVVNIDADGFVSILGRTKRFAKIGGEMISLTAIETIVCALWPEQRHVAVSVPHTRKGEMIVLLTENENASLDALPDHFRLHGLTELSLPKKLIKVKTLPLLGSGKMDYVKTRQLAIEELGTEEQA